MEEPSNKKQRFDGDEVEATIETTEIDDEATAKAEEDAREREEEEKVAKVTVRMKGIPFEGVTESDIAAFFDDCEIAEEGIFIAPLTRVAYVEFKDEASVELALKKGHNFHGRSITISKAKPFHRTKDIGVAAAAEHFSEAPFSADSVVIQIRTLPYWTTEDRVMEFYKDFEVLAIHMVWDHIGRERSNAFLEFQTEEERQKALEAVKNIDDRGKPVICEHSKLTDMLTMMYPTFPEDAIFIKITNIPFAATEEDVVAFFEGLNITGVYISKKEDGKLTGIGFATVETYEDAFIVLAKTGCSITCNTEGKIITQMKRSVQLSPSCKTEVLATLSSYFIGTPRRKGGRYGKFRNNRNKRNNRGGHGGRYNYNRGRGRGGRGGRGRGRGGYQGKRRNREEITGQPKPVSKEELDREMDLYRTPKVAEPIEESMVTQE